MKRTYKIAVILLFVLIVFGGVGFYIISSLRNLTNALSQTNQTGIGSVSLTASVSQQNVFDYDTHNFMIYSLVSYSVANSTNTTVSLDVYARNPIQRIYLVNVSRFCVSCFDMNQVRDDLRSSLSSYDLVKNATSFNYITLENLSAIPSNSMVVILSGLIPVSLINDTASELLSLMDKGDTIIYVGLNFSKSVGPNGLLPVTPPETLLKLNKSGLGTFTLLSSAGTSSYNLTHLVKPTFVFSAGARYENVTYANARNGTIVAFSNYQKSSWNSVENMTGDLAKAINARFWMQRLGHYTNAIDSTLKPSGAIGAFAATSYLRDSQYNPIPINSTYALVTVSARNQNGAMNFETEYRDSYRSRGGINVPSSVGETQNIPLLISVNGSSANSQFHLELFDSNMSYVSSIPIGFISSAFGVVKYYAFTMPSGYYAVSLKDFDNNVYANSFFQLDNVTLFPTSWDFKNASFRFSAYSNGFPINNATYTVTLNGAYGSGGFINGGAISYVLPRGTIISFGNETFDFRMFNDNYTYVIPNPPNVYNIPPIYIEFAIAIAVVVLLNLVLKPPNRDEYYVDVPEFPPSKREKVKVKQNEVLGVFDKVNYYYHWKYMPLTSEEVRSGIGNNIRINNMPISITSQNTNTVIFTLMQQGKLESASGYYAPSTWVEASGHSVEYLTVFRKLRDYCVSHAMLFTDLDASEGVDMFITKNAKQLSIFIYTNSTEMRKLTLSKDTRVVMVCLNDDAMHDFYDKLYASYGKDVEILKLGIEYNYIRLIDADHLDQLSF